MYRYLTQLVPSTIIKSQLFLLTNDEFEQLCEHMKCSKYRMEEEGWDTIIIGNTIFKKIKLIEYNC